MLLRHVRNQGLDPVACEYELVAFGPIFPEQEELLSHRAHRDRIAPLEAELARLLAARGFTVVGTHGKSGIAEPELLKQVQEAFNAEFASAG